MESIYRLITLIFIIGALLTTGEFGILDKRAFAGTEKGFIVNEESKLCTFGVTSTDKGNLNLGDCVVKDLDTGIIDYKPGMVCKANGYTYTNDAIATFCTGELVGYPEGTKFAVKRNYYVLLLPVVLVPLLVFWMFHIRRKRAYETVGIE